MSFNPDELRTIYNNLKCDFEIKLSKEVKKLLLHKYFFLDYILEPSTDAARISGVIVGANLISKTDYTYDHFGVLEQNSKLWLEIEYLNENNNKEIFFNPIDLIKQFIYSNDKHSIKLQKELLETDYKTINMNDEGYPN